MQGWQSHHKKKVGSHTASSHRESRLAFSCLQIVDGSLLGILFIAPLFFGGRHPLGRFVFICLACLASVAWLTRQAVRGQTCKTLSTWGSAIGLASILLVLLQIVPLPAQFLEQLSLRNIEFLPLWTDSPGNFGAWETISVAPNSTRIALATLIGYVLLFVTTCGRLQELPDIERLLSLIALATIMMSIFGILQYFTSNNLFFWFYEYPYATTAHAAKGSFTSRNHFAHFLALGFSPLLAWIILQFPSAKQRESHRRTSSQQSKTVAVVALHLCLAVVALAILLSLSRGGVIALAITSTIAIAIYYWRGLLAGSYFYGLAMLGLIIVGMLSLSDYERVASRIDDFTAVSLDELDPNEGRRKIWAANIAAIQTGSLVGSGAGSHREIYPVYLPEPPAVEYTHSENGYLQITTENGWLGAGLLVLAMVLIFSWCLRAMRNACSKTTVVLSGAVTASLVASAAHSAVDFIWFIPACMSVTILLAACAFRLAQLTYDAQGPTQLVTPWARLWWLGLTATTACAAVWAITTTLGPATASLHWDRYLLTSVANQRNNYQQLVATKPRSEDHTDRLSRTEAMIFHLQNTLTSNPQSAQAHLRLAGKYLEQFNQLQQTSNNAMSIDQIRDAAMASQFDSAQTLQKWLLQAFGENSRLLYRAYYHAREGLKLCPLRGEGYLYLANLCFLEGQSQNRIEAYVAQGLRVRPYDGGVLLEAGRQLLLLGQAEKALRLWQQVYRCQGLHQLKIARLLSRQMPIATFVEFFQPDWQTLRQVWQSYRQHGTESDLEILLEYAESAARQECPQKPSHRAANIWRTLAAMQGELDRTGDALQSMQLAYHRAPSDYLVRRDFGRRLLQAEQYAQAEPHLRWCLARRPDDAWLKRALVQATKSRLSSRNSAANGPRYR